MGHETANQTDHSITPVAFAGRKWLRRLVAVSATFTAATALAGSVSTVIGSEFPTTVRTPPIHAGDTVTLQAKLSTDDPDENSESEPLVIKTSGGFTSKISEYEVRHALSFEATSDDESIKAYIPFQDRDEYADITVYVNQRQRFTQEQKQKFSRVSNNLSTDAAAASAVTIACAIAPDPTITKICAIGGAITAAATGLLSVSLNNLSLDPPDPNYTTIPQPDFTTISGLPSDEGIDENLRNHFNEFINNESRSITLSNTILTAINRANTAAEVGDSLWENRQLGAAAKYAYSLSNLLNQQAELRRSVSQSWKDAGYPIISISSNNVFTMEARLAYNGLNSQLSIALDAFSATSSEKEHIRKLLMVQDSNDVATSFPANLANSSTITSLEKSSNALRQFALENASPLTQGEQFQIDGYLGSGPELVSIAVNAVGSSEQSVPVHGRFTLVDHNTGYKLSGCPISHIARIGKSVAILSGACDKLDRSSSYDVTVSGIGTSAVKVNVATGDGYSRKSSFEGNTVRFKHLRSE